MAPPSLLICRKKFPDTLIRKEETNLPPFFCNFQILEDRGGHAASSWRRDGRARSRSRSGSHERRRRGRRSRSKSRDRNGRRRRSRSPRDRKESERDREKKREREKKGLPPIKRNCLSGKTPHLLSHLLQYQLATNYCVLAGIDQLLSFRTVAPPPLSLSLSTCFWTQPPRVPITTVFFLEKF